MIYCQVIEGVVVNRAVFDAPLPADWPDFETWVLSDEADIGSSYVDGVFHPPVRPELPSIPPLRPDANARLDAGLGAALTALQDVRDSLHAIPAHFNAANFQQLLLQAKILSDTFVAMLQAQTVEAAVALPAVTEKPEKKPRKRRKAKTA